MTFINKEELLKALEKKYGNLEDRSGCNIRTEKGYNWLSVSDIVNVIDRCTEFEDIKE